MALFVWTDILGYAEYGRVGDESRGAEYGKRGVGVLRVVA